MANDSLRFDIIGNDNASSAFSRVGEAARNMGGKMDTAARQTVVLDEALKRQQTATRASVDATLSLARADEILTEAEHMLRDGALEAELALKRETEAKKQSGKAAEDAAAKNAALRDSFKGLSLNPGIAGPALLAAPLATSLAGVGAGAAIGLGGAFATSAVALGAFGAVAKSVLSQAATAAKGVQKAQDAYNLAIAEGTDKAKAYKTEQQAIAKAYQGMSPAQIELSKELGTIIAQWQAFKTAVTPMIASSLQPWLHAVATGVGELKTLLAPMAPVVHELGVQFDTLVGSSTFRYFVAWIGQTGAKVTGSLGNAVMDLLTGMTFLLPQFTPLMTGAAGAISKWGDAFVRWSASQKAADEIHSFLEWFHENAPAVKGLLVNVGDALKALTPGLTSSGAAELNLMSSFFGFIAKLPPGLAKPLGEVAATMLILQKMGVFSVGIKLVGLGVKGRAAAAAGEGAAPGLWQSLLPGVGMAGNALTMGLVIGAVIKGAGDTLAPKGTAAGSINKAYQASPEGATGTGILGGFIGAFADSKVWTQIQSTISTGLSHVFTNTKPILTGGGSTLMQGLVLGIDKYLPAVTGALGGVVTWIGREFSGAGSWLYQAGKNLFQGLWNGSVAVWDKVAGWIGAAISWIGREFAGSGSWLYQAGKNLLQGLWNGSVAVWDKVAGWIGSAISWIGHVFAPSGSWLVGAGKNLFQGLWNGSVAVWDKIAGWIGSAITWIGRVFAPSGSWLVNAGKNLFQGLWNGAVAIWNRVASWIGAVITWIGREFASSGAWLVNAGRNLLQGLWNGAVAVWGRVASWFGAVISWIGREFSGAGNWLYNAGKNVIQGLWNGLAYVWNKVASWISSLAGWIKAHKGPISLDQTLLEPAGRALMQGLKVGLEGGFVAVQDIISGAAGSIGNQFNGLFSIASGIMSKLIGFFGGGGSNSANQALGQRMAAALGWTGAQWSALQALWNRESGWSTTARNPSSGAYGIPQSLPASKMASAGGDYLTNPATQIRWGLSYIAGRYGSPLAAWAHETAYNWYAGGTLSAAPGWGWVGEQGPELIHFRGGEQVTPASRARAGNTITINVSPTPLARPADIGRDVVTAIREYEKRSGISWRS